MINPRRDCKLGVMKMYSMGLLFIVAIGIPCSLLLDGANGQLLTKQQQNPCSSKRTCQECLQTFDCGWCLGPNIGDDNRCAAEMPKNCSEEYWYKPKTEETIIENKKLTKSNKANADEIVQIQPQRLKLKLRLNEEYSLRVNFSQAEDYPVDLYYLMDLSKSMEDDKQTLSTLGNDLSKTMKTITSNFRLGFGSFIDKVLMPFTLVHPNTNPKCHRECSASYGYRNHMALSTNVDDFTKQVKEARVANNLDAPEGGFDAIMQAIVCRSQIGWRTQARRLLVFSTDDISHYAGDGKLGGIIVPNDGECHLDEKGYYTYSTIQDYPSISQINQKVKDNSITIIFAVTSNQRNTYDLLSKQIEGSVTAVLSTDSGNVVQLVKENYEKITSSIELKDNASNNVKITYYSSCLNGGPEIQTSKCDGLKVGSRVEFTAKISVSSCPANKKDWNQVIQIYPVGIKESLTIDLELLCSCDCEKEGLTGYEKLSKHCNGAGTYMCGICDCGELYNGRNCECSNNELQTSNTNYSTLACRADNTTQIDCNGRGTCLCGQCKCEKPTLDTQIISGEFCELDNFSCENNKNQLCSGPDQGTCGFHGCECKPGFTGTSCGCSESTDTCMPPDGDEICSGHGDCECGTCKCKTIDDVRYSGRYCERCPNCLKLCNQLKDCVQCQVHKSGPLKNPDDCSKNCTSPAPISVEKVEADAEKDEQLCVFYDEEDCKFTFKYVEENNQLKIYVQDKKECPPKVFMLGIVLGVIAAIVLVGLAILLLWKLIATINDRREYTRFEKERMNAQWDQGHNPLYREAQTTVRNPMYVD